MSIVTHMLTISITMVTPSRMSMVFNMSAKASSAWRGILHGPQALALRRTVKAPRVFRRSSFRVPGDADAVLGSRATDVIYQPTRSGRRSTRLAPSLPWELCVAIIPTTERITTRRTQCRPNKTHDGPAHVAVRTRRSMYIPPVGG